MIEQSSRRTKVIKSYETSALSPDVARQISREHVDVVRVVYEHATRDAIGEFLVSADVTVMLDVATWRQGQIRGLKAPMDLVYGDRVRLSKPGGSGDLYVTTDDWSSVFSDKADVFIGYGSVALRPVDLSSDYADMEVIQGGTVYSDMDLYVPATRNDPSQPRVSLEDLRPLLEHGVHYLIIPGQWSRSQIEEFRDSIRAEFGEKAPWFVAKVDAGDVYEQLEDRIEAVDGILISRREMALTVNPATVPMITKEMIQMAANKAKVVVTASEMLASMRHNAFPTRAEVSDVANAVIDGTDAVVLSEEVSHGAYATKAAEVTHRIICDVESGDGVAKPNWTKLEPKITNEMDSITYHAYQTAERVRAQAIVCITKSGNTALRLASFRPPVPVIAVTFSADVRKRLSLIRGVEGLKLDIDPNLDEVLPVVNDHLVRESWLQAGDPIIFVTVTLSPVGKEASNLFTIQHLS